MEKGQIHVLVVCGNGHCWLWKRLTQEGHRVHVTDSPAQVFSLIRQQWPDIVVMNASPGQAKRMEMLAQIRQLDASLPVMLVTDSPDFREAIEAVKLGADDYLESHADHDAVIATICRAALENRWHAEIGPAEEVGGEEDEDESKDSFLRPLMGPSETVCDLETQVALVAPTNYSVVLVGETGVGKELVAQAIHRRSPRANQRFLSMDCGAIPEPLIENELFGHERGAYTGADRTGIGRFEAASKGTLFLDEITNLSPGMQSRLLRVLEEKKIFRVGGTREIPVDVRILAATNRDLGFLIQANAFREDLFHRLSEYIIVIPPLRVRREDILPLANRFLQYTNLELGKRVKGFSALATDLLLAYHWPGNVRELRNVVRGGVLQAGEVIEPHHLRILVPEGPSVSSRTEVVYEGHLSLKQIVQQNTSQIERTVLLQALERAGGNKAKAARLLGIDYKTIHTKLRQYGIKPTFKGPTQENGLFDPPEILRPTEE